MYHTEVNSFGYTNNCESYILLYVHHLFYSEIIQVLPFQLSIKQNTWEFISPLFVKRWLRSSLVFNIFLHRIKMLSRSRLLILRNKLTAFPNRFCLRGSVREGQNMLSKDSLNLLPKDSQILLPENSQNFLPKDLNNSIIIDKS